MKYKQQYVIKIDGYDYILTEKEYKVYNEYIESLNTSITNNHIDE